MIDDLSTILHHNCLLDTIKPVIVGVSGGADSLCLLYVLQRQGYPVVVAHLDHMLRPSSKAEARQVQSIAASLKVPFVMEQTDIAGFASQEGQTIEAAARVQRYLFLFRQAEKYRAQAVAVGHHADDQVETVLMHLLRGAGLAGMGGMQYRALPNPWSAQIALVRPLLGVWKQEIQAYVAERGYPIVVDESNQDRTFLRNRVRHDLIPVMESYNPQVRQALWRMADLLRGEQAALESLLEPVWQSCLLESGDGYVALDALAILKQPAGVQRRLARMGLDCLRPGLDEIDLELVERAREFLSAPPASREADLGSGLRIVLEGERLWIADWHADLPSEDWPQLPVEEAYELKVPGKVMLANGWLITAEQVALDPQVNRQALKNRNPYQAFFDAESLPGELIVRARRPGDRMAPLGMGGHSLKLSDLMINLKVAKRARAAWPLVVAGGEVVWAPGMRQAHAHLVGDVTSRVVILRLEQAKQPGYSV